MNILHRMHNEHARLTQKYVEAQTEHDILTAEIEHVNSSDYLEQWARADERLSLPGEVAVIPLFETSSKRRFTALDDIPSPEDGSFSISEQWRRVFFDAPVTQ